MTIHMNHAARTGISNEEIMKRAKKLRKSAPFQMSLQEAVDHVIDAAIEANQGK